MVTKGKTERQANTYTGEFGVNNQLYFCGLPFRLDSYSGCSHNCSYCLSPETTVLMADFTSKEIKDIKIGDKLVGFDENPVNKQRHLRVATVLGTHSHKTTNLWKMFTPYGEISCTGDHPWLSATGVWVYSQIFNKQGSILKHLNSINKNWEGSSEWGKDVKIQRAIPVNGEYEVIDIETDTHTFIAEGFATHNCFARSAELTNLSNIKRKELQTLSIIPADPSEFKGKLNLALDSSATRADINIEWLRKRVPIHWGGMSDPFQPCELKYRVSKSYMDYMNWYNYPVAISTKGTGLISTPEYIEMLKGGNYFVQITMLTDDPILAKIEKGCPPPQERLGHIQKLIDAGITVAVRVQPVIPNTIIEKGLPEFIYKLGKMGVKHIIVEGYKVQARQNEQMKYIWDTFPEAINEYKYSDVKFEGFELLLPSWRKWQYVKPAIQAAHESGMTYGAADNDMRSFGDTICCCGADNIKGFENFWRYQSSQAAMIAKEKGQVSLEDMQQFWSGNNDEIQSGNILNNEMHMEVYGYQKGKAGENKEKAKANGNMLACQAGKMGDDAKTNNIRNTAKYCVDWMWNAGGANSPENDVNLKKSQDNGKLVYKWQDSVPMLENKQVKQGSLFDGF